MTQVWITIILTLYFVFGNFSIRIFPNVDVKRVILITTTLFVSLHVVSLRLSIENSSQSSNNFENSNTEQDFQTTLELNTVTSKSALMQQSSAVIVTNSLASKQWDQVFPLHSTASYKVVSVSTMLLCVYFTTLSVASTTKRPVINANLGHKIVL